MMKSLLLGTILGGLVASVWSSICWKVLQWHEKPLHIFQNEDEVAASIASHATQSGIYLLPVGPSQEGMTAEQKKVARAVLMEKMRKGPITFAAIRRGGFGSYARGLMIQLLSLMVPAFLLIRLLFQTSGLSYRRRVLFLAVAGLTASVIVDLPNWNWSGFSGVFTAANLADFTLMWLFAGLVVAKVAKPQVGQSGL